MLSTVVVGKSFLLCAALLTRRACLRDLLCRNLFTLVSHLRLVAMALFYN